MTGDNLFLTVVDTNDETPLAVERAAQLAGPLGAAIELFACCYDEHIAGTRFFDSPQQSAAREKMVSDARDRLEELAAPLRKGGTDVKTHACWDRPEHEAVAKRAVEIGASVVLHDCHFHNVISRAIFSHEDWQLVRTAPCPLLLVKKRDGYHEKPRVWAAVDPMHTHDKPASLDAEIMTLAKSIANGLDATLDVVHTYDPASALAAAAAPAVIPAPLPLDKITEEMRDTHGKHLFELADAWGVNKDRVHNVAGSARVVLPGLAIEKHIDVLLMGAVARSGFDKLVIGSTAEKILDHLPCDALIVKPKAVFEKLAETAAKGR